MRRLRQTNIILITACMALGLSACGNNTTDVPDEGSSVFVSDGESDADQTETLPVETGTDPAATATPKPTEVPTTVDILSRVVEQEGIDYLGPTTVDTRGDISYETAQAVSTMVYDYLLGAEEETMWEDVDTLVACDETQAEIWMQILDDWDRDTEEGFLPDAFPEDSSLCFVVLGYHLNLDGSMRPELVGRLETALAYAEQYPNSYLLLTGGETSVYSTEADQMAEWLMDHGVSEDRLILETQSLTTADNALYSYRLIEAHPEIDSLVIITSDYHLIVGTQLFQEQCRVAGNSVHVIGSVPYIPETESTISVETRASWLVSLYLKEM